MSKQVKFVDEELNILGGIELDDGTVICGCCGSIFEPEDIRIITRYNTWVNLTEEICGDDVNGVH